MFWSDQRFNPFLHESGPPLNTLLLIHPLTLEPRLTIMARSHITGFVMMPFGYFAYSAGNSINIYDPENHKELASFKMKGFCHLDFETLRVTPDLRLIYFRGKDMYVTELSQSLFKALSCQLLQLLQLLQLSIV